MPVPEGNRWIEKQGRYSRKNFSYDSNADVYRCPADELLHPMKGSWQNNSGRIEIRYAASKATCEACKVRESCLSPKASRRTVSRWEHEDVLERHQARMQTAGELMRRRSGIVEHPFGTIKCRAGYRHFLLRGFNKVRGEWSLMALCYNFTRVLNILGFEHFVARLAEFLLSPQRPLTAVLDRFQITLRAFWVEIMPCTAVRRPQLISLS